LQENTPEEIRGKIFATLSVVMTGAAAIPVILAGGFADLFGTQPIFVITGILVFMIGMIALKPERLLPEEMLPLRVKAFLGFGHWEDLK
jgi:MFS family permease